MAMFNMKFFNKIQSKATAFLLAAPVFNNPITQQPQSLPVSSVVGRVVQSVLGLSGILAVVFIIIGGTRIILANGNEDQVKRGKDALLWAVIGIVIAFAGYVIVGFVLERIGAQGFGLNFR